MTLTIAEFFVYAFVFLVAGGVFGVIAFIVMLRFLPETLPTAEDIARDDAEDELAQLLADGDEPSLRAYRRRTLDTATPSSATIYPRNAQ